MGPWPRLRNDLAATAATLAALLITLSTVGDFQRKWQANRMAAAATENLAYELLNVRTASALERVVNEIQAINDARNRGIIGDQLVIVEKRSYGPAMVPNPTLQGPFRWTKSADDILAAIRRFCRRTRQIGETTEARH